MSLTNDDLKKIDEIASKHTEDLAVLVSKGFERVEKRLEKVEGTQAHHSAELHDHTKRLERIERKQDRLERVVDHHDLELDRLLKHAKLKPLSLER